MLSIQFRMLSLPRKETTMSLPGAWPTKPCMPPPLTTLETTKSLSAALHGAQSQYEMLAALQYAALEKCANRRARLGLYDPLP